MVFAFFLRAADNKCVFSHHLSLDGLLWNVGWTGILRGFTNRRKSRAHAHLAGSRVNPNEASAAPNALQPSLFTLQSSVFSLQPSLFPLHSSLFPSTSFYYIVYAVQYVLAATTITQLFRVLFLGKNASDLLTPASNTKSLFWKNENILFFHYLVNYLKRVLSFSNSIDAFNV